MATFYENLQKALKISNHSLEDLAQHIGCEPSDLEKYNSESVLLDDINFPNYTTMVMISKYLGFSVESLISGAFPVKKWDCHSYYEDYNNARNEDEKLELFKTWGIPESLDIEHDYIVSRKYHLNEVQVTNDLKVALFGGDVKVTDEMWNEVKEFAKVVTKKHNKQ